MATMGDEMMKTSLLLACIVLGALTTVTLKMLFQTLVVLPDGSIVTFDCAIFASLLNYLGMSMLVPLQALVGHVSSRISQDSPVVGPEGFTSHDIMCYCFGRSSLLISACSVMVTLCTQKALLYVPATVYAALRQGNIPMIAAIRVYFLQKSYTQNQSIGACVLTLGLVLMGAASHTGSDDSHNPMQYSFGVCLLCFSAVLLAGRYVAEEVLMQRDRVPPMIVVGAQGFLGSVACALLLVFAHRWGYESFWHTLTMLRSSAQVQALVVEYVLVTAVYNLMMAYTTQIFDATCKAMIRGTKPISVWCLELFCFYYFAVGPGMQQYGEAWLPPRSWYVLAAGAIVTIGLCLYFYKDEKRIRNQLGEDKLEYGTSIRK